MAKAKIKHTKNELKAQRDALKRFERYLPTLQLKKQQLQLEVRRLEAEVEAKAAEEQALRDQLSSWVALFSEPFDFEAHVHLKEVLHHTGNIAGVNIPVLNRLEWERTTPDLWTTAPWVDTGIETLQQLVQLRIERGVLEEQYRLLGDELRTTNQRVNLFEKVKIPECRDHIRVIRVFLGDQMTAAVARSKIAKGKSSEKATAA